MSAYTSNEIVAIMSRRGWGFGERRVFNEVVVSFSRRDWHGHPAERPVTVARFGPPEGRDDMVRYAGREALRLWDTFRGVPPEQYFDIRSMTIVWDVRSPNRTVTTVRAARE